jgi:ABC-type sugar transport system substrate-binding protein
MQRSRLAVLAAIGAAALPLSLGSTAAFAQAFPNKPVRLIVRASSRPGWVPPWGSRWWSRTRAAPVVPLARWR